RGGSIIACGLADGNLKLWKHSTGEVLRYFNGHTEEITALALIDTPKGVEWLVVISASKDKNVRTWLYAKEKSLRVIRHQRESYCSRVNALAGPVIVSGSMDNTVRLWSHQSQSCLRKIADSSAPISSVAGHHPVLLSGSWDTTVSVWDLLTMEYKRTLEGHTGQGIRPEGFFYR
ncbi:WD40-repeat-containing domain protein, partial [Ochromonadaceae sp. CCMP2298]